MASVKNRRVKRIIQMSVIFFSCQRVQHFHPRRPVVAANGMPYGYHSLEVPNQIGGKDHTLCLAGLWLAILNIGDS